MGLLQMSPNQFLKGLAPLIEPEESVLFHSFQLHSCLHLFCSCSQQLGSATSPGSMASEGFRDQRPRSGALLLTLWCATVNCDL